MPTVQQPSSSSSSLIDSPWDSTAVAEGDIKYLRTVQYSTVVSNNKTGDGSEPSPPPPPSPRIAVIKITNYLTTRPTVYPYFEVLNLQC
jgi:hypothetical protein